LDEVGKMKIIIALTMATGLLLAGAETEPWMPLVNAVGLVILVALGMVGIVKIR
jgi:hypothetical protein